MSALVPLTTDQLKRLRRIAIDGPLVVGTRTTERMIGDGIRSLERRGLVFRFTAPRGRFCGMVRITDEGREALKVADCYLQLFDERGVLQCT